MQIGKEPIAQGRRSGCGAVRLYGMRQCGRAGFDLSFAAAIAVVALALGGCSGESETASQVGGPALDGGGVVNQGGVVPSVPHPRLDHLAEIGAIVGQFELAAPSVTPFTLHGTFPVPRGAYVECHGLDPFQIIGPNGQVHLAQTATVTRYPDAVDGADVVELMARVDRPANVSPGDRIRYAIRFERHPTAAPAAPQVVQDYLAQPGTIELRTRDVFDHVYEADLYHDARTNTGSARVLKRGRTELQAATHSVLLPQAPVAGNQGTLPHHMGAHAYVTQFTGENFVALDLRVHNAFSGLDDTTTDDNPLGKVYFRSLELVVPQGWSVVSAFADPFLGAAYNEGSSRVYPIVAPITGTNAGQLHMMPAMGQFHRRLAIARTGSEARALAAIRNEGLAFAREGVAPDNRELFSWWFHVTGRWFSQRQTLPSLLPSTEAQVRATLAQKLTTLDAQVTTGSTGQFPVEADNMGWAHPWGINDGGMVSGSEIFLFDGVDVAWSGSREGYRVHELTHRMYSDRQPNVLFNDDGSHTRMSQWVVHGAGGDFLPIWWYNSPMLWAADPFGYGQAPTFQVQAVSAQGRRPWYEDELLGYHAIDLQHLVRYTRSAKVLLWLGNDAIAKDDIVAQAEGFRIAFPTLPQDLWGNIIPTGMLALQNYVSAYPHTGVPFGRGESWGLDAALVAYSVGSDEWRAEARPWLHAMVDLLETAQAQCSSVIQATPQYNVFGSQYRCRQSIEAAIMENALVGLRETVLLGVDPQRTVRLDAVLRRAFYAMISPLVWSSAHHGPWAMMAVGPFDMAQPLFCSYVPADGNYGFADHYQIWSSFAYAFEITGDPIFLQKAAEALGVSDFVSGAQANSSNWQNKAALIALAQQLADDMQAP